MRRCPRGSKESSGQIGGLGLGGLSSFGLSAALIISGGGVVIVLLAQVGLFAVMTWYNGY